MSATTEPVAMTMMIYSLVGICQPNPDASMVFSGLDVEWRLRGAIEAHNASNSTRRFLLIAGFNDQELANYPALTIECLVNNYGLVRTDGVHCQIKAAHTLHQAEWAVSMVKELGITSLEVFTSPFHLLRSYCTLVKALENAEVPWIPILPGRVRISPDTIVPIAGVSSWELVEGEVQRLLQYQTRGHVATLTELQSYLRWYWATTG